MALARASLAVTDEVLFVLPRAFPHKVYDGASFPDRLEMLRQALGDEPRFSIASTDAGLFLDIARQCRGAYPNAALQFVCGRDAAERIMTWDYGRDEAVPEMLREFEMLVASRGDVYEPPAQFTGRIHPLPLGDDYRDISASEVRARIARGEAWESLVPAAIVPLVARIYLPPA